MKKISIIYWSGTGNTEQMAQSIAEGAREAEGRGIVELKLLQVSDAKPMDISEADIVAFGSPAMGVEEIDDTEMLPFIEEVKQELRNKSIGLFGSYGWSEGEWIEDWQSDMEDHGAQLITEPLMVNSAPDQSGIEQCKAFGALLSGYEFH